MKEEAEILCSGKLSKDRQAAVSIFRAVFSVPILPSGFTFYTLVVSAANDYAGTLQDMLELDSRKCRESIGFVSVSVNWDRLNIPVKSAGPCLSHLIWLRMLNEAANTQDYCEIDFYANSFETVSNVGSDAISGFEGEIRTTQLVTELVNTFRYGCPESEYDFVDAEGDPSAMDATLLQVWTAGG